VPRAECAALAVDLFFRLACKREMEIAMTPAQWPASSGISGMSRLMQSL